MLPSTFQRPTAVAQKLSLFMQTILCDVKDCSTSRTLQVRAGFTHFNICQQSDHPQNDLNAETII